MDTGGPEYHCSPGTRRSYRRSCPYIWFSITYGILEGGYAFTIGIGCCRGLFLKKQAGDQLERTPQNPHPDPPVGQILEFGRPNRCSPLGKLCHFSSTGGDGGFILVFWDIFPLQTRNAQDFFYIYGRYRAVHKGSLCYYYN